MPTCANCGVEFIQLTRKTQHYCTPRCRRQAVYRASKSPRGEADCIGRWVVRRRWISATEYVLEVLPYGAEDTPCPISTLPPDAT